MATKQAAKGELQKLKALTDTTEVWSRRVQKFWKSTTDICLSASESFSGDSPAVSRLQTQLKEFSSTVCTGVGNVKDVAQSRYSDLSRSLQETAKSKQKGGCCQDISRRIGDASVEIATAIFSTFHHQANGFDELTQALMEFQRCQLEEQAKPLTKESVEAPRNSLDSLKKREMSSDENNIELDWDAFDRDLSAMSQTLGKLGEPRSHDENDQHLHDQQQQQYIQHLKKQLRQAQQEGGDLMKRTLLAEHALEGAEKLLACRRNSELKLELDTGYNQDDFLEMRKALRKEQLARLELEQRLRDAREEIKASQFAFRVAKTVANRIADSAEISEGALLRCQSERQFPDVTHAIPNSLSAPESDQSEMEAGGEAATLVAARSDSAFFERKSEEGEEESQTIPDPSNPFTQLPPAPQDCTSFPQADPIPHHESSNPFLQSTLAVEDKQNPFLCLESDGEKENPFEATPAEEESNPFLTGDVSEEARPHGLDETASNPFAVSKDKQEDDTSAPSEWNPFAAPPTASNPFLSF